MKAGFLLAAVALLALSGCENEVAAPPPLDYSSIGEISYSQHVQPLLNGKCATSGCHESATKSAGLDVTSWEALTAGSSFGETFVPYRPDASLLTTLFDGTSTRKAHPDMTSGSLAPDEINFLKRWVLEGAQNDAGQVASVAPGQRLYVCNQGDDRVAIIDKDELVVRRYINVGNSPAIDAPHFVAADADFWYVSLVGARQVWKFDATTDTLIAVANVTGSPAILALTPDGSKLYVSQFMASSTNTITVLNTATMTVQGDIPVWTMPHGMKINNAGDRLYVANMMSDNLSVIDVATDQVLETVPLAYDVNPFGPPRYMPMEVAVSPNDSLVMVSCSEMREVRVFDAWTHALLDSIPVGDQPWHLEFTPDGQFCYVCDRRDNTVSVIHVPMGQVMQTLVQAGTFAFPHGCSVTGDGRYTFVSNENVNHLYTPRYNMTYVGNITVIDIATNQVVKVLEVGEMPTGIYVQD